MKPVPIAKFRVYPTSSKLFVTCFIWRSLRDFRRACPGNSRALGLCRGFDVINLDRRRRRLQPVFGEIHLIRRYLTMRIITHECTHAAFRWSVRARCHPSLECTSAKGNPHLIDRHDPEERFCHALSEMATQIVKHIDRKNLWHVKNP